MKKIVWLLVLIPQLVWAKLPLERIQLPPGFKIELVTDEVPQARAMALSPTGTIFVGSKNKGNIYQVSRKGVKAAGVKVIAKGYQNPIGIAYAKGDLYFSDIDRILKIKNVEKTAPIRVEELPVKLPSEKHHGGRYLAIGPDQKLYFDIGVACNVCEENATHGVLNRMNLDGSGVETYAKGIRNTVGFDWHPQTKQLWFTDNGRDLMGDDVPSDELNFISKQGQHFGFPYCHEGRVLDPDFGKGKSCESYEKPVQLLGAHVAALGMRFYTGKMFPEKYRNQIFIAQHGSWNRSKKSGYQIVLVTLDGNKAVSMEPFATGWMNDEKAWGRPVDLRVDQDGALLVSDDEAGAIYRIVYQGPAGQKK